MLDIVHCRYTIGAVVLRVCHEGKEWHREEKIKCDILKESAAKKVLRPIIQQSTKIDIYKIQNILVRK